MFDLSYFVRGFKILQINHGVKFTTILAVLVLQIVLTCYR